VPADQSTGLYTPPVSPSTRIEPNGAGARISDSGGDAPAVALRGGPVEDADLPLIERLAAGELEALHELYERHKSMAYSIAMRITGNQASAEDAVQDAFLGVWRSAGRYVASRASVRTWLLTIVHRRAIDVVRRRRADVSVELDEGVAQALLTPDLWEQVSTRLDRSTVVAALGSISVVQREAIELAYFDGLTQTEIASRTGVALGTVKGRLRLGLLGLRRVLVNEEPDRG
jgi:RNA polymerase sigma-70 factor (ECF subfamily)